MRFFDFAKRYSLKVLTMLFWLICEAHSRKQRLYNLKACLTCVWLNMWRYSPNVCMVHPSEDVVCVPLRPRGWNIMRSLRACSLFFMLHAFGRRDGSMKTIIISGNMKDLIARAILQTLIMSHVSNSTGIIT